MESTRKKVKKILCIKRNVKTKNNRQKKYKID